MAKSMDDKDFPRAILHVDGDAFFVSCELTRKPWLKDRAVVTGEERGIATALNQKAKALGLVRGMRTRGIRRNFPEVVILPSDYLMYAQYAERMYSIVRRYTDLVEEYSIDECFADITGLSAGAAGSDKAISYEEIARAIQAELHASLGVTFSVGLAVNKVTAKAASKWKKPAGLIVMPRGAIPEFLKDLPIGKVWGIGTATTIKLRKLGISTALDLANKDRAWVALHCDKPLAEIYEEFQGNFVKELAVEGHDPASVQRTRTFYPPVGADPSGKSFLWSQISYHAEDACGRLRSKGMSASRASFFLKTQSFQYIRGEAVLPDPSAAPNDVLRAIQPEFDKLWWQVIGNSGDDGGLGNSGRGVLFRAAGISLGGLVSPQSISQTLFDVPKRHKSSEIIHQAVDLLARKFGSGAVFLGSSLKALKAHKKREGRPFNIIYLGVVR